MFNALLYLWLPIPFIVVVTLIGIAVGGGLALLFCGMSLVFVTIKRKKRGKDNPKLSKVGNYNSTPKIGNTSIKMRIWKSIKIMSLHFIIYPIFMQHIILKLTRIQLSIILRRIWVTPRLKKMVWCYRKSLLWRCRGYCIEPHTKVANHCGFE